MNKKESDPAKNDQSGRKVDRVIGEKPTDKPFREIEEYLNTLIYQSPAVICAHQIGQTQWHITYISDNIESILGFKPDELIGDFKAWKNCVHPKDMDGLLHSMRRAKTEDDRQQYEYRFKDKKGEHRWLYDQQKVVADDGQTIEILSAFWDITERKELAHKYQTLVENLNEIIYTLDDKATITYISPSIEPLSGYQPEEVIGRSFLEFVHPEDLNGRIEHYTKTLSGVIEPSEYRFIDKQGRSVWIKTSAKPIIENGTVTGIQGVLTDITDLKQAEEAIRESQARFARLAEQSRTVTWEVDADGSFTYVSHVAKALYGYQPKELVGRMHFYDLHPDEGREAFKAAAIKIFREKKSFNDMENPIRTKDGKLKWVSTTGIPRLNDDGSLRGYWGSDTDITDRKRAEMELRESEKKFRVLSNDLPAIICEFLPDGTLTFVNKAYREYFGISARKIVGRQFLDFIPAQERESAKRKYMSLTPAQPVTISDYKITVDEQIRWLEWRTRAIFDACGQILKYQGIGLDISERKQREKQLRETSRFHRTASELTTASANLRIDAIDEGIQQCLRILGNFLSVQQGYIFTNNFEKGFWHKIQEWCAEEDQAQAEAFQSISFETFPGLIERFQQGESLALGSLAELPAEMEKARHRLSENQVKALIMQPMLVEGRLIGFLGFIDTTAERIFTATEHALLSLAADNLAATFARHQQFLREKKANEELKRAIERAKKLATTDELTDLWNRRHFMDVLEGELERANRYGHLFSVLTLDIDHFKRINDTLGHAAGDEVLQHIAEIFKNHLRHPDIPARMGGEEFSLLLPHTNLEDAAMLAERLRSTIEQIPAVYKEKEIFCTVSIGATAYDENVCSKDDLLLLADKALYRAKEAGRNRVVKNAG